ncbi:MAG TPA: ABC transporter substrate-binding protein [Candidatus Dormibacteraeota bacterium]|nr:ABC transporter substrate-binding protein [Candidatus Dormibacteraeota bacterium]
MRGWRGAALGIAAALLIVACGGGSSAGGPPHGNVLQVAAPGDPDSLDPMAGISGFDVTYLYQIYDTLIHLDPRTDQLEPGLATSWSWSPDKRTLQLKLRHGVKFQDGTSLDAEAVKESLDHARSFQNWPDLQPVTSVTVVDADTVALHVDRPYAPLPALLTWRGGMVVSPTALKKYGKDFGKHPVGAGPFSFQSWAPGDSIKLTRFAGFWQADQTRLKGIDFHIITSPIAELSALRAGQLDVGGLADLSNLASAQNAPNLNLSIRNSTALSIVTLNNKGAPFNNPLVRRAANMSIDRHQLAVAANTKQLVDKGIGGPAWQYVPPGYWPYSKDLKDYPYDPAQARRLLAEAGYPNGVTVQLCNIAGNPHTIPEIEQQEMAKAGFNVVIQDEPVNSCVSKMQQGTIPMVQIGWAGLADPYQTYATMFGPLGNLGPNPQVDALLDKAAASYTRAEQKAVYDQLNKVLFDLAPSMPLYYNVVVGITSKRVTGVVATDIVFVTYFKTAHFV